MSKQEYKNGLLTKKKIASAYLSLLIERPKMINVTQLIERAGLHRGTFYIHFENIKSVETYIQNELAENFKPIETDFRSTQLDKTPELILEKLNEILKKDLDFYRLFINAADNTSLMEAIKNSILSLVSNNFKVMRYVMNFERFKVVIQYIAGGVIGTYTDWFKGNIECSLEELKEHLSMLIKTGLKEFISDAN